MKGSRIGLCTAWKFAPFDTSDPTSHTVKHVCGEPYGHTDAPNPTPHVCGQSAGTCGVRWL